MPSAHEPDSVGRPLPLLMRTLNNIHSAPRLVQQLHPHPSPSSSASGKRKTAVELLAESKAFYVKTERVLDQIQEPLPHCFVSHSMERTNGAGMLQHHPNRSPMLCHPSARIREHFTVPFVDSNNSSGQQLRSRNSGNSTPPVEKRRLSIRKADTNPLPTLNVTAVKRFLSRPQVEDNVRGLQVRKAGKLIGLFSGQQGGQGDGPVKSGKSRINFSEVLPSCICHSSNAGGSSNAQPPELPHRTNRNNPSPPPPIPPKSPALNAKLRLLSQQQQMNAAQKTPVPLALTSQQKQPGPVVKETPHFRRIQSEEAPTSLPLAVHRQPYYQCVQQQRPSTNTTAHPLIRHHLHKSLPDLNSPKNGRRSGAGRVDGRIRSASTDLDSCSGGSECSSRSSSVHMGDSSSESSSQQSDEDDDGGGTGGVRNRFATCPPGGGGSRSERATTSDYASRSPSFKQETTSLVQTSQTSSWILPPWQDDVGVQDDDTSPVDPTPKATTDQVNRRRAFILRSKSDVGPSRFAPDLLPAVPPEFTGDVPDDLDRFFDTIGHQEDMGDACDCVASGRSSPVYFSSVSSIDSNYRHNTNSSRHHVDNMCESSDSDDLAATLQRRLLGSQPGMGEPSIVERNARIIKWLIKCRNLPAVLAPVSLPTNVIPSSNSSGQLRLIMASVPALPHQSHAPYYGQSTRL